MIHPTAIIPALAHVQIGKNVTIDEFVIIRSGVEIDDNVTIKCRATVSGDTKIEYGTFIGPHALILHQDTEGNHKSVSIGANCYIGAGAIIMPGVQIGDNVTIGAGSLVTKDCLKLGTYVGTPCRKIR